MKRKIEVLRENIDEFIRHRFSSHPSKEAEYVVNHSHRVADLSLKLAQKLNALLHLDLTDEKLELLYVAGLLHDTGKPNHLHVGLGVALADEILTYLGWLRKDISVIKLILGTHSPYAKFKLDDKDTTIKETWIYILGWILYVVDKLDRPECQTQDLKVEMQNNGRIVIRCLPSDAKSLCSARAAVAQLKKPFGKEVVFE